MSFRRSAGVKLTFVAVIAGDEAPHVAHDLRAGGLAARHRIGHQLQIEARALARARRPSAAEAICTAPSRLIISLYDGALAHGAEVQHARGERREDRARGVEIGGIRADQQRQTCRVAAASGRPVTGAST